MQSSHRHGKMPEASDKGSQKERCQRHQTKVASHTEKPLGFSKWLEQGLPYILIACRR